MSSFGKVGRVSKAFGRRGELIVNLYDTFPEDFDKEGPLFAYIDALAVPLYLERFERRGTGSALVTFADFDSDARASELIGRELYLRTEAEEENDGEIYMEDLVGFSASFDGDSRRGTITSFVDSDANPLFEVTVEGREILIPAAEEMIASLDIDRREIEFSLPEGLLDLYM